ncbi:MAG: sigma-54 dependent transcriptional regulator [Deltaproteobacteria bacterium]|jgi:two-component system nitrogen regulation response regulator NtrX|nr:sigma-54 dependent transcriptional regulator [Deltaproteobacteria bacterium]
MPETILVVDDEADIRTALGGLLTDEGYLVSQASDGPEACERLEESAPSMVILDLWMGGSEQGFDVLEKVKNEFPQIPVVVISGHGNIETAVKAVRQGAYDFIEKPLSADKIILSVHRALNFRRLSAENQILRTRSPKPGLLAGRSKAMAELLKTVRMVAPTPASVLISGENGVGKELVAHTIHDLSQRADRPMIELNCAAIPEDLVESELFGHEKGAFTGAGRRRQGRFDMADHSTLFLDEIGDMSLKTQAKILRILQEQKFERVGGARTISVDVRVIAASNKNLETEIAAGRFRNDLYYRLNVVPVVVPPLRERADDVPELACKFLDDCLAANNLGKKTIGPALMENLRRRPWPGNVRELKNTVERLAITTPGPVIEFDPAGQAPPEAPSGPERARGAPAGNGAGRGPEPGAGPGDDAGYLSLPYREAKTEFERRYFMRLLARHDNNISQTAETAELERSSLYKKLKALGLKE